MQKIQGIGGVFLYANDAVALAAWYADKLGLTLTNWGSSHGCEFPSADLDPGVRSSSTVFAIFQAESPLPEGVRTGRVNYRTADLDGLVAGLRAEGLEIKVHGDETYGRFAEIRDPEGNRIELWEPPLRETGEQVSAA